MAGGGITLEAIIATVPPSLRSELDKQVDGSDQVLRDVHKIAGRITEWDAVANSMGLTAVEISDINLGEYRGRPHMQK